MSDPVKPTSRHGLRAEGKTLISIPAPESLKRELQALADADQRTLSAFLRIHLTAIARRSRAARRKACKA